MKKKEFEWFKNWVTEVIIGLTANGSIDINEVWNEANEKYPPPIDEEKPKISIGAVSTQCYVGMHKVCHMEGCMCDCHKPIDEEGGKLLDEEYQHDGGPHKARIRLIEKGYIDGFYRLELAVSDPTDYERFKEIIKKTIEPLIPKGG